MSLVLDLPLRLDPSGKLVLVTLADHVNERDGCCAWPSNETIARRTGICERQVRDHRASLEAAELIELVSNHRGGRGKAKVYRLNVAAMLAEIAKTDPKKAAAHCRDLKRIPGALPLGFSLEKAAASTLNPAGSTPKPGSPAQETRQPAATEPVLNRNLNRNLELARASGARNVVDIQASGQTLLNKVTEGEPEEPRTHLTREQHLAFVEQCKRAVGGQE